MADTAFAMGVGDGSTGVLPPRLQPLTRMLEATLKKTKEDSGLSLDDDGACLLTDLLSSELVRPLAENLCPGMAATLEKGYEPPEAIARAVVQIVREAAAADGSRRFEFRPEGTTANGWLRLLGEPAQASSNDESRQQPR